MTAAANACSMGRRGARTRSSTRKCRHRAAAPAATSSASSAFRSKSPNEGAHHEAAYSRGSNSGSSMKEYGRPRNSSAARSITTGSTNAPMAATLRPTRHQRRASNHHPAPYSTLPKAKSANGKYCRVNGLGRSRLMEKRYFPLADSNLAPAATTLSAVTSNSRPRNNACSPPSRK